ncbi:uncharacterized protein LOC141851921 [Brevipalpus obovatus]|uniref:uncharacterized protein LOC141851921 n=1 Tax=Brevipalpus obovatus TaxID=246614 RepID=UPI003D9DD9A8
MMEEHDSNGQQQYKSNPTKDFLKQDLKEQLFLKELSFEVNMVLLAEEFDEWEVFCLNEKFDIHRLMRAIIYLHHFQSEREVDSEALEFEISEVPKSKMMPKESDKKKVIERVKGQAERLYDSIDDIEDDEKMSCIYEKALATLSYHGFFQNSNSMIDL